MNIHIIRHGKTFANQQKLYCGKTDLPLSESGIADILKLKKLGIYPKNIDLYFTSPYVRACQTLEHIYGAVHKEVVPNLAEYNFGSFEMKNYEELKENTDYQAWITDETEQIPCPGGESKQEFTQRVLESYDFIINKSSHVESILLVSHGGVITCVMEHLFPNTRNFYEWQPEPGRGYTINKNKYIKI